MKLTIGFYCGLARRICQETEIVVQVPVGATLRDVSAALAARYPGLVGPLIASSTFDLVPPHFLNINGQRASSMDDRPRDGDRILLMAVTAGG